MQRKRVQQKKRQEASGDRKFTGFSLMEVLLVIVLMELLVSLLTGGIGSVMEQQRNRLAWMERSENLDAAMNHLCDDIRRGTAIADCLPDSVKIFTEDGVIQYTVDADPQEGDHLYGLDGMVLYRKKSGQSVRQPVSSYIGEMELRYYGESGEETTDPASVKSIVVNLKSGSDDRMMTRSRCVRLSSGIYL